MSPICVQEYNKHRSWINEDEAPLDSLKAHHGNEQGMMSVHRRLMQHHVKMLLACY
ncbi:predicted protein [Sclerotinia sclerotiorum 1980 UF-70]|uniref:Uncharacterized protein n=1 Tax=Sclerotinia sclerotiorum (strain ATCC 18683 / 1980 / Ss-1) TaxID=665079 RepID=A7E7E0_SCLS1|nr:predicted protein [Sclerotinia sclerotiorum 1980 UF-70]EDN96292.1 predicted protein [Sclerotinia sclerotiorum 1980 UF-70]